VPPSTPEPDDEDDADQAEADSLKRRGTDQGKDIHEFSR
jgi:hypothetical protein